MRWQSDGFPLQSFRAERESFWRDGPTIWAGGINLPRFDPAGRFETLLGVSRDSSKRKRDEPQLTMANRKLQELASSDGLTGVWNRPVFPG